MKKQSLKIAAFKSQLSNSQIIDQSNSKNIKGGGVSDPPPWGTESKVVSDPPPWGTN